MRQTTGTRKSPGEKNRQRHQRGATGCRGSPIRIIDERGANIIHAYRREKIRNRAWMALRGEDSIGRAGAATARQGPCKSMIPRGVELSQGIYYKWSKHCPQCMFTCHEKRGLHRGWQTALAGEQHVRQTLTRSRKLRPGEAKRTLKEVVAEQTLELRLLKKSMFTWAATTPNEVIYYPPAPLFTAK